ncbi:hypothetical protein QPK87_33835 [Kamptonema cortianum]|nr:hypothetical protein [Kamptonema cortianum]
MIRHRRRPDNARTLTVRAARGVNSDLEDHASILLADVELVKRG